MNDEQSTDRDVQREDRRLQRLRLVVTPQQDPVEDPEEELDPDPLEAA